MSTISTSAIRRHIFHFVVLESNSSSIQINSKRKKRKESERERHLMIKKREELRKRKKYYRKVCLRLRSSDSSNIGDQAGGKFHLLHHCSWWCIQFEFSYKFWLEPYEKKHSPRLRSDFTGYILLLHAIYNIYHFIIICYYIYFHPEKWETKSGFTSFTG